MTCEEVIDKEDENWYQRTAGFLPVDGEDALEEIDVVKTLEIADINPFAGLYQIDADTDEDTEYESDADVDTDVPEECKGVSGPGGLHGDGHHCRPPTIPDARRALEDLTSVLYPPNQKLKGRTSLDPNTFAQLEDIRNFLWWYCEFDANGKPKNPSAGNWMKASFDVANYKSKGSWQAQTLRTSARAYVRTQELPTHNYQNPKQSRIDDKALSTELQLQLQSVGKYISAQNIVDFTKDNDVQM